TRFSRDWSSDVCSSDLRGKHPKNGGGDSLGRQGSQGMAHRPEPTGPGASGEGGDNRLFRPEEDLQEPAAGRDGGPYPIYPFKGFVRTHQIQNGTKKGALYAPGPFAVPIRCPATAFQGLDGLH